MSESSSQPSTGQKPWNDINKVEVAGRIGIKPEVRQTKKNPVANTTLYITNEYDNASGRQKKLTRVPVIVHGEMATKFALEVNTGDSVRVKGRLQENVWKDESQKNRSRIEIVGFEYEVLRRKAA